MVFNVARIPPKWDALRHRVRAERALAAGDWATAIADYEALLRSIPGTVEDWLGLGHAYLRVGRFDKTDAVLTRFERQRLNVIQRGRWQELDAMLHDRVHNRR
jgi:tetratricopeptide (TPR) repeat protein